MNKSLKRIALMLLFVLSVVCAAVAVAACNKDKESGKVTYTVTVTTQTGLTVTDFKAQWLAGEEPVSEEIALDTQGKASVELDAGEYTVTLKGVPDGYSFTPATVNSGNRDAAITVVQDETKTIAAITVRLPAGISYNLTAVSAQIFKDGTAVGTARALTAQGMARIPVPRDGGTYNVRLLNLPDFLGYTEPVITASNATATATINTVANDIEYTVNISCEEDIGEATVTFYNGEDAVEGATELPIVDKQVKKTLKAGNYTAKLNTDDITVSSTDAQLTYTAEGRTATLAVTITKYIITLDKPANVTANYTDIRVTLTKDGDVTEYSATAGENGVANVRAPLGKYGIKVTDGSGTQIGAFPVELTETVVSATVKLAVIPTTENYPVPGTEGPQQAGYNILTSEGRYYISIPLVHGEDGEGGIAYTHGSSYFILRTTGEDAGPYYSMRFDADGADGFFIPSFEESVDVAVRGECTDSLTGRTAAIGFKQTVGGSRFQVMYGTYLDIEEAPSINFIVTVTKGEIPPEGYDRNLAKALTDGENSVDASMKSAWFSVPEEYACHKIEFGEGMAVTFIMDIRDELQNRPLTSGSYFRGAGFEPQDISATDGFLFVESENGNIKFTLTSEDEPGSTPKTATVIQLDTEYQYNFGDKTHLTDKGNRYYVFTPEETGSYDIVDVTPEGGDAPTVYVYKYVGDGWDSYSDISESVGNSEQNPVPLVAETKYLFALGYKAHTTAFKVVRHPDEDGDFGKPLEIVNVGETPTTVTTKAAGGKVYLYHKVTAESLNAEGNLVFDFKFGSQGGSGLRVYFYSDPGYSELIIDNDWEMTVSIARKHIDDTIYFTVSCYASEVNVYINKPEESHILRLNEPVEVIHEDSGGENLSVILDIDESVTPGEYVLQYNLNPAIDISSRPLTITDADTQSELGSAGGYGSLPIPGSVKINLTQGIKKIKIEAGGGTPDTYTWTFTLKAALPVLKPDTPLTTDISKLGVDIEATAGRYKLTYTFNASSGMFPITIGDYNNTAQANTETVAKIEITGFTTITWENVAGAEGTVTFKLEAIVDPEIEETTPLPTKFEKGDESLHLKLKNVNPAKFNLKIEVKGEETFTGTWTIEIGEKQFQTTESTGLVRTAAVEIPFGVNEIILKLSPKAAKDLSVELTLTKTGELDVEKLVLDSPYDIWLAGSRTFIEIPIDFTTENGLYNISLDFTSAAFARSYSWYAEVNSVKTSMADIWFGGFTPTDVYIPANCQTLKIGVDDSLSEAFKVTATVTKQDVMFPGTSKEIVIGQYGATDFKAYFTESGAYKVAISGEGIDSISIRDSEGVLGLPDGIIVKAGTTEGTINLKASGTITLEALGTMADAGKTVNVTITRTGDYVPDLKLGEQKTVEIPAEDEDATIEKTIQLEAGDYKITLSGKDSAKIQVKTGFDNDIIIAVGDLWGTFTIGEKQLVILSFIDPSFDPYSSWEPYSGSSFDVKVETTVIEPFDPTITVGTEKTVTIPTKNDQTIELEVALEAGQYKITLDYEEGIIAVFGDDSSLSELLVPDDNGDILKETTFNISDARTYTFTFQDAEYVGGMEVTILIEEVQA